MKLNNNVLKIFGETKLQRVGGSEKIPGFLDEMISPDESVELLIKSEETEVVSLLPISRKSVTKLGHHLPSFPTDRRAALNDTIPDRDKNGPPRVSFGIRGRGEQKDRDEHLNVAISLHVSSCLEAKVRIRSRNFDRSDTKFHTCNQEIGIKSIFRFVEGIDFNSILLDFSPDENSSLCIKTYNRDYKLILR